MNVITHLLALVAAAFVYTTPSSRIFADEVRATEGKSTQTQTTASTDKRTVDSQKAIAASIKDLGSDSFEKRNAATKTLVEAGPAAVPALVEAANSNDLELPNRCIAILRTMLSNRNEETAQASKAALQQLAKSDKKYLARRAAAALKNPPRQLPARLNPAQNRIVINGRALAGRNISISQKVVNGQRETNVKLDDKSIVINDENGKDISVKVTETVEDGDGNQKEQTKTYTGDDIDDLKKKHPEAAKLYEQYAGNARGRIRVFGGGLRPAAVPGNLPANARQRQAQMIRRQQESLQKHLDRLAEQAANGQLPAETFERIRNSIQRTLDRLDEQAEALE